MPPPCPRRAPATSTRSAVMPSLATGALARRGPQPPHELGEIVREHARRAADPERTRKGAARDQPMQAARRDGQGGRGFGKGEEARGRARGVGVWRVDGGRAGGIRQSRWRRRHGSIGNDTGRKRAEFGRGGGLRDPPAGGPQLGNGGRTTRAMAPTPARARRSRGAADCSRDRSSVGRAERF